ncbi:MAG: PAS domain S-box protein [Deltaproteobacteria bacterium]|nr:PAS domain S-box protein [Deltaproteobacteria bacterium]
MDILLVEDEHAHVELIRRAFEDCGDAFSLTVANTLKDASWLLTEKQFDLVLFDFLLPDGKGTELLRDGERAFSCPFVLMTSHGDEKLAVEALKAGALDYVVKSAETFLTMPKLVERALREWKLVQERRQAEEALRQSEEKFRAIADYSFDLGVWFGVNGELLWANRAIERFTGRTFEECRELADHLFASIHDEDREAIKEAMMTALAEKSSGNNVPFRMRHRQGSQRWVSVSWLPIYSMKNEYLGIRANIRDIHELKRALENLEEANHELDAFVYTVSHDLRTPLTPIIGFAQLLEERFLDRLDDSGREMISCIEQQGRNMLALLEDLLRLARAGYLERPAEPVDTGAVVREVILEFCHQIQQEGIEIKQVPLPHAQVPKTLLKQVFENLIQNAILYAGKTGSPIEIGGEKSNGKLRYFVRDHGPGVPAAERKRIFDVFSRGSGEKKTGGTGVGLATVRKIARQYGGFAWVEETPGGGATFWLTVDETGPLD